MKYRVYWETDGETVDLPNVVTVPDSIELDDVAGYLSDTYGWLVNSLELVEEYNG